MTRLVVACDMCSPPTELLGEFGDDFVGVIARHYIAFHPKESRKGKSPEDMKLRFVRELGEVKDA